jgi:hypothetical protein
MWIPDRIYERLPLVYAVGAVASWFAFGLGFPTVLSTVALGAASVLTFAWRRNHRQRARRKGPLARPPLVSLPTPRRD